MVRLGGWAFRHRSWLPVPLALVLVLVHWGAVGGLTSYFAGEAVILSGLALRFWAVRHIGTVSRTRAGRKGPLIRTGPYALVRNPLYIANFLLWIGCTIASGLMWMLPVAVVVFGLQYGAIARWEEAALREHFGSAYDEYSREVARWIPSMSSIRAAFSTSSSFPVSEAVFSERGTLLAAALMSLLIYIRHIVVQ